MAIKTYDTLAFLARFMTPSADLDAQLRPDPGQFFIVRLETMYRQVNRRVPPSRSLAHSCLLVTSGAATICFAGTKALHPSNSGE